MAVRRTQKWNPGKLLSQQGADLGFTEEDSEGKT